MNNKHKHLEFIQNDIARMSQNSFWLRGWFITLFVALMYVVSRIDESHKSSAPVLLAYFLICMLFIVIFVLDIYFLKKEKLFRDLYEDVRKKQEKDIDFSMDTSYIEKKYKYKILFIFDTYSITPIVITSIFYILVIYGLLHIFLLLSEDYL